MHATDTIIIGAGPIGIELAAMLKKANLDYIHLEANQIGHTISQWPREAQFFSAPERVALAGIPVHSPNQQSLTGEMYLGYLRTLVEQLELRIKTYEPVTSIEKLENGEFIVETAPFTGAQKYQCRRIVLATGNMSRPRRLEVSGDDLPHVDHALVDPHKYFQKRILIVGGKNSALEAALRCWRAGASVAISYRRDEFENSIVKPHLAREIRLLIDKGKIDFYPQTVPEQIETGRAHLRNTEDDSTNQIECDFVLFCVGYEMDMTLLEQLGVNLSSEENVPEYDKETMETNVPNVYLAGTAAGGMESRHELFIVTSHEHVEKIVAVLTNNDAVQTGAQSERNYDVTLEEVQED